MNRNSFAEHVQRNWRRYLIAALAVLIISVLATAFWPHGGEAASHVHKSKMMTIATYDHGQKVQVNKDLLWGIAFFLFIFGSSFDRKCKCKCEKK